MFYAVCAVHVCPAQAVYSRISISRTPKGIRKLFEMTRVRDIEKIISLSLHITGWHPQLKDNFPVYYIFLYFSDYSGILRYIRYRKTSDLRSVILTTTYDNIQQIYCIQGVKISSSSNQIKT